ncbi:hypothetical protein LCGC14_1561320 [marine sediment metagenome]|uniref:Uncharacterized protein n=1 Tax=marine sediment metagenome TaxID=412755 RepID=A0A0F9LN43_9ZZZZ
MREFYKGDTVKEMAEDEKKEIEIGRALEDIYKITCPGCGVVIKSLTREEVLDDFGTHQTENPLCSGKFVIEGNVSLIRGMLGSSIYIDSGERKTCLDSIFSWVDGKNIRVTIEEI